MFYQIPDVSLARPTSIANFKKRLKFNEGKLCEFDFCDWEQLGNNLDFKIFLSYTMVKLTETSFLPNVAMQSKLTDPKVIF